MGYSEHPEELDFYTNYCGDLYQNVMNEIHENLPAKDFEFSDEIEERYYCANSGLLAGSGCPVGGAGWYKKEAVPSTCTACRKRPAPAPEADAGGGADAPADAPEGD